MQRPSMCLNEDIFHLEMFFCARSTADNCRQIMVSMYVLLGAREVHELTDSAKFENVKSNGFAT